MKIIFATAIVLISVANGHPLDSSDNQVEGFVIGGNATEPFIYPFICSLQIIQSDSSSRHTCGATILTNEWILTAAHCVYHRNLTEYSLQCGRWNISAEFEDPQQTRFFDRGSSHINFTFDTFNPFDVAVVSETSKRFMF